MTTIFMSCILQTTGVKLSVSPVKKVLQNVLEGVHYGSRSLFLIVRKNKQTRINSCSFKSKCDCDCFRSCLPEQIEIERHSKNYFWFLF